MITFVVIWVGIGTTIAAVAKKYFKASWGRAIGGGFIWPTYPALIGISRFRYGRRRRSLS